MIEACDQILTNESNARFWIEAKFLKKTLQESKANPVKDTKIKIVGETNSLMDLSKELQKGGYGECITCDGVDMMLVDLAQDTLFAEAFEQAIPRTKENHKELNFNTINEIQFNDWIQKRNCKKEKK